MAQTLTLCASATDTPCTTGEFETLPTHHGTDREWSAKRTPRRGNYSPGSPAIHWLRRHHGVGEGTEARPTSARKASGRYARREESVGVQAREGSGGGLWGTGGTESTTAPARCIEKISRKGAAASIHRRMETGSRTRNDPCRVSLSAQA